MPEKTIVAVTNKALSLIGNTEQGKTSRFSKEKVMTFKDMPVESYELDVILQHGTTYEQINFLAHPQVVVAARMVQDHAEQWLVQRALANKLESNEQPQLQKIGQKHVW